MRKVLSVLLLCFFMIGFMVIANAEEVNVNEPPKDFGNMQICLGGVTTPFFGSVKYNAPGKIIGYQGINSVIGYTSQTYFKPLKFNAWNWYLSWGTLILIFPYIGAGVDYQAKNGLFAGLDLVYFVLPNLHIGWRF